MKIIAMLHIMSHCDKDLRSFIEIYVHCCSRTLEVGPFFHVVLYIRLSLGVAVLALMGLGDCTVYTTWLNPINCIFN